MSVAKRILRRVVYQVPGAQAFWVRMHTALGYGPRPEFSGWGMETDAYTPWRGGGGDELSKAFLRTNTEVLELVASGRFVLSQFRDVQDIAGKLRELMWRHYVVFWSASYAAGATGSPVKRLVECGVCDGLSSYFAMSAVRGTYQFEAFLYDAWRGMEEDRLLESERTSAGAYAYLSLENTRRNLAPFASHATFVEGFIPDTFSCQDTPADVAWLHVDLNASVPTTATLHEFFDRMPRGGVILLDDYAWQGFHDTKVAADAFFAGRPGQLLPLPTGQAMFFKL